MGEKKITGEIVRLEGTNAVIQVYEDETGLKIGADASSTGRPLSAFLGPGLIGKIYDGIQRPLEALFKQSGVFMESGSRGEPLDPEKLWPFVPDPALVEKLKNNEEVPALPGLVLGTVKETESIVCKIMVPPRPQGNAAAVRGLITWLAPPGD